jgi:hypothetical protein
MDSSLDIARAPSVSEPTTNRLKLVAIGIAGFVVLLAAWYAAMTLLRSRRR